MKHIKENIWDNIISEFDVYQLYELLYFKYGDVFKETKTEINSYEGSYNPDEIYDTIQMELIDLNYYDDFIKNYKKYEGDKNLADPFYWKHRGNK